MTERPAATAVTVADGDEYLEIRTSHYTARIDRLRLLADVTATDGRSWGRLRLLASVHTLDGPDETVRVESVRVETVSAEKVLAAKVAPTARVESGRTEPAVATGAGEADAVATGAGEADAVATGAGDADAGDRDAVRLTVTCVSSRWETREHVAEFRRRRIDFRASVRGCGEITTVRLLGGDRLPSGTLPSGAAHRTVFSPNPDHPWRLARAAVEPATIAVNGEGGEPGVGRWIFTPAPTCFGLSREPRVDDRRLPAGEWLMMGLEAARRGFVEFAYDPSPGGFSLRCEYQGHTAVDGDFTTPTVLLLFGAADPYDGLRRYRDELVAAGLVPVAASRPPVAPHWRQPIFCGWGDQCAQAAADGPPRAPERSRQDRYERLLEILATRGLVPGTIVVDDKWQRHYATCRPDLDRWPDLPGFVAARRERGQRVLLWWKAWDPEGAPEEACVRDPAGRPLALDPESAAGRTLIEDAVTHMLAPGELDADGLKIDFIGRTPSGRALRHAGPSWGFDLLHELLTVVYRAAKRVKPDSLLVTHTPDPGFIDVTDMIRLNDVLHLDHPEGRTPPHHRGSSTAGLDADFGRAIVEQMTYRARVVHAACPELPVDTDGWCLPGAAELAAYAAAAPRLGVPALYYADQMDLTSSSVDPEAWAAVAAAWDAYRQAEGLLTPGQAE